MSKHLLYCKDLPNPTPPNSLRLVLKNFLLALILLLPSSPVWAVYYVKPTGSDRNSCTAIQADPGNTPARSIQRALDCVARSGSGAGKEVRVYAGSYVTFSVPAAASGSATGGYLLIRANPGDTVNVANTTVHTVISTDVTPTSYIQVEGLSFSGPGFQGMSINFGNNIRILNSVVSNTETCIAVGNTTNLEISGNWLHHCANNVNSMSEGHGVSLTGNSIDVLIDNNLIEDVGNSDGGYGLFLYGLSTGSRLARITVSNNILRRNATYGIACMGVSGDYCKIYNNVVNNNAAGGMLISAVTNPLIYNNTIYANTGTSIEYEYSSNTTIRNNIFYQNNRNAPTERTRRTSSRTVINTNLTGTNPSFVDATNGDFHIESGSAARNTGVDLFSVFTTDIVGTIRPQGAPWDIGAYAFVASGNTTPTTATITSAAPSPTYSTTSSTVNTIGTASSSVTSPSNTVSATVNTPTITPNGSVFNGSISVSLADSTPNATIYYTTNGASPTQSSKKYTGPITLSVSTLVKAKAFKSNFDPSPEASAWFANAASPAVSPSGLVAHWKFDEGSGTSVTDSSGNGNNGTLINGPLWTAGRVGNGLYFDGINDNVTIPDSNSLDLSNSFTLSAWVNPASTFTDFRSILVKNYSYYLYASVVGYCGNGSPLAGFVGGTDVCQPSPLPINTWTHLAVTYNGSTLTLYQNGIAVAATTNSGALIPTIGTLQIGASQYGEYFKGLIDEVRIYNKALSVSEIQTIYQQDSATPVQTVATPVISPNGGTYSGSVPVTMQTATSGASIYYTTDGSTPTTSSTLYTGTMTLTNNATLKAKAFKIGYNASAEASVLFTVTQPFNFSLANSGDKSVIAGSSVTNSISATLASGSGQSVSFSVSGLPSGATASLSATSCSPACSSTLTINTSSSTPAGSSTITVAATGGGVTKTTTFRLTVTLPTVAMPSISPGGGSYTGLVSVTMQTATAGAVIYYTTNGSTPTQSSMLYTAATTLTSSAVVKAKAFRSGYNASAEASASFTVSPAVAGSGLVAHWKFDEGSGTSVTDSSGNGNNGTLINGPLWTAGRVGNGLYFDGINDNVTIPDSNSLDLSNSFTLSAWVNPASTFTDFRSILVKNYSYYLYASVVGYCGNGSPLAGFVGGTDVCQPSPLPINTWTHLAVTYNGSTLTLYQNGIAVAATTNSGALIPTIGTLQIGASQYGEYFKGLIDEVRIYNKALSVSEIQTIYQQDSATPVQTVATPVISPNGGTYSGSVPVTMQTATSGASIYYTTDGSTPTTSSTLYTGTMTLTNSATLKAKAFKIGYNASAEASASFTVSPAVAGSGLVAHWKFDEGSGTSVTDSSGNGNNGTLINGPLWTAGRVGNGLYFDGINDNVTIPDSNSLDLSNSFTLSAWVNPASTFTDFRSILVKNYSYYLYASVVGYCGNGSPLAGFVGGTDVCQPSPLPINTWTHLAVTYNGSTLTLYQNGIAVAATTNSGALIPTIGTLQIGASQYGEYFKGLIDEVRIYNRALSGTEIQSIYQQDSVAPLQTVTIPVIAPNATPATLFLSWEDTSNNEGNFQIERKTGTDGTYIQIALVSADVTSYVDSDLIDGTNYCYRVSALNSAGMSGYSNEVCNAAP